MAVTARFAKMYVKGEKNGTSEHQSIDFSTTVQAEKWKDRMDEITSILDYVITDFYIDKKW